MSRWRAWTEAEDKALQSALDQGLTHKEIGEMLGRKTDSVECHIRGLKLKPREPAFIPPIVEVEDAPVVAELPEPENPLKVPPIVAEIPPAWWQPDFTPYFINDPGIHLLLYDIHIPYHVRQVLELAVEKAKKYAVKSVGIVGDGMDSGEISDHLRDRDEPSYISEIYATRNFNAWLRGQFPDAQIWWKEGNHEERLVRYLIRKGFALRGLEGINLKTFVKMPDFGINWIENKRVIRLGNLNVLHGHEYQGISTPVNPARGLYLKARSVAICGHFHRTSEHFDRPVTGKLEAAWSVGCMCNLNPKYRPLNNWNHGFAFVIVSQDGSFEVLNKKVFDGKVI